MADFFELRKNGSTVQTEIVAGFSSFLATSYIIVVNPGILSLVLIPFTYFITQDIIWGGLSYTVLKFVAGKRQELSPALLIIDIFCVLALFWGK